MADPSWVREGLDTLNAYRRILKDHGDLTEEELAAAEQRRLKAISDWAAKEKPPARAAAPSA